MNDASFDPYAFPSNDCVNEMQLEALDEASVSDSSSSDSDTTASPTSPETTAKNVHAMFPFMWHNVAAHADQEYDNDKSDQETSSESSGDSISYYNLSCSCDCPPSPSACDCPDQSSTWPWMTDDSPNSVPDSVSNSFFTMEQDDKKYARESRRFGEVESVVSRHPFLTSFHQVPATPYPAIPHRLFHQLASETREVPKSGKKMENGVIRKRTPKKSNATKPSQVLHRQRDKLKRTLNGQGIVRVIDRF